MPVGRLVPWMDDTFFRNLPSSDDDRRLRSEVLRRVRPEHELMDLGAGSGCEELMNFRGCARRVCGVDPDPRVTDNPFLDEAKVATGDHIPYLDESFDVVVASNVLEHLEDPASVFREVARVLKPGGVFLAKTPNWLHYMPPLAMLTPIWLHYKLNPRPGGDPADIFPTRYRVNTPRAVRKRAAEAGLVARDIQLLDARPGYLAFSSLTYFLGAAYHWLVTRIPGLHRFRGYMIVALEKPA